ncbi:MAG: glycosyltransferase family 2 protein [Phycisphaerales bacterium]|jgi:dolichol-phosphate mannosyltransferase|nr:glycosyltransferase family 2 protein [Phycisphaerales bacterium]
MRTQKRILVGIPVYNEAKYINPVLSEVCNYANDILVVDDGSTDLTPALLAGHPVEVIRHSENRGYGRSLQDMFRWATVDKFDWLITMDCDEQHEPAAIPRFVQSILNNESDIISGSRYLELHAENDMPPEDRQAINRQITEELNVSLGFNLTDAFCGFKAYRVDALSAFEFDVNGYEFPLQLWVQAAAQRLRVEEVPVRLIYNDPSRTFGGPLDDPQERIDHYRAVLCRELGRFAAQLPRATERVPC